MQEATPQHRYWNELVQLRAHLEYLSLYHLESEHVDRGIKIFLAVSSSASIAAWVIWSQFQFVWAGLIAASQFVNSIRVYLPYARRLRRIREVTSRLEVLFLSCERTWQAVADGELDNAAISRAIEEFKREKLDVVDAHLGGQPLPSRTRLRRKAAEETEAYFDSIYGIGGTECRD